MTLPRLLACAEEYCEEELELEALFEEGSVTGGVDGSVTVVEEDGGGGGLNSADGLAENMEVSEGCRFRSGSGSKFWLVMPASFAARARLVATLGL